MNALMLLCLITPHTLQKSLNMLFEQNISNQLQHYKNVYNSINWRRRVIRDETSKRKKKLYSSGLIFAAWTGMRDIKGGNSFVKQNKTEQKNNTLLFRIAKKVNIFLHLNIG